MAAVPTEYHYIDLPGYGPISVPVFISQADLGSSDPNGAIYIVPAIEDLNYAMRTGASLATGGRQGGATGIQQQSFATRVAASRSPQERRDAWMGALGIRVTDYEPGNQSLSDFQKLISHAILGVAAAATIVGAIGAGAGAAGGAAAAAPTVAPVTLPAVVAGGGVLPAGGGVLLPGIGAASIPSLVSQVQAVAPKVVDAINTARTVGAIANGEVPPPPLSLEGSSFREWATSIAMQTLEQNLQNKMNAQQRAIAEQQIAQMVAEYQAQMLQGNYGQYSGVAIPPFNQSVQDMQLADANNSQLLKTGLMVGAALLGIFIIFGDGK